MRLTTRQNGIISYAGLDADALWAGAKRAFSQADGPVPERFLSFLPIFPAELIVNMSYVGVGARMASPAGFSTDPQEYHRKLCEEMPDLYTGDNYRRCFDYDGRFKGGVVTVDAAWATRFPQYRPFQGEKLMIHMIGGGHQAVAVPESVFPRGGGVLEGAERELRVTARCEHFCEYARRRLVMGERYDPVRFEEDYLRQFELAGVCVRQRELSRVMQDLCILRGLQDGVDDGPAMFTESALRAGGVRQYVPWRYACDTFEPEPVTRGTARLMQLYFEEDDPVEDLWLPYQDASGYIDRQRMALDVRALCEGFQIAPAYDARTHGGRYPSRVRVVVVRDRDIRPMVADTLNNPAYGSGMGPMGMLNKLVFLADSRELLRQNRLMPETLSVISENTMVDAEGYRRMCEMAALQEWKGRLLDALYRRESALSQMQPATSAYKRADELLTRRVNELERRVRDALGDRSGGQLSGYDADIDYLRRMQRHREGVPDDEPEPMPFSPDSLRELCIESGYAMRGSVRSFSLDALLLPSDGEEADEASQDAGAPEEACDAAGRGGAETRGPSAPQSASEPQNVSEPQSASEPQDASASREDGAPEEACDAAGRDGVETRGPSAPQSASEPQNVSAPQSASEPQNESLPQSASEPQDAPAPREDGAPEEACDAAGRDGAAPSPQGEVRISHAARVRQSKKKKKQQSRLRFEQIDMFGGVRQTGKNEAARDARPEPPPSPKAEEEPQASEPTSEPRESPAGTPPENGAGETYVLRSLAQLTGAPVKAGMGKMAQLISHKQTPD